MDPYTESLRAIASQNHDGLGLSAVGSTCFFIVLSVWLMLFLGANFVLGRLYINFLRRHPLQVRTIIIQHHLWEKEEVQRLTVLF